MVENSAIHYPVIVCKSNYKFRGMGHRAEPSLILYLIWVKYLFATLFFFDNFYGVGVQEMRIVIGKVFKVGSYL